jgi:hypothetical protein
MGQRWHRTSKRIYIFMWKGNANHELGCFSFVNEGIILAFKWVKLFGDRVSYIILRGRWCDIIVLNVHAPTEDKIDDMKISFCDELERVFDNFSKCYMKNF